MVRLENLKDLGDRFIRVRLTRIEELDLKQFEFDFDLTFAMLFFSPEGKLYARYGGRDATGPDSRQSLAGLRYTMQSVLAMHEGGQHEFAPRQTGVPLFIQQVPGGQRYGLCLHCHQVKEVLHEELKRLGAWRNELAWRYPLPERIGLVLEVDHGNVVDKVLPASPSSAVGIRPGDVVRRLNDVPIHAQADVQFALDRAPAEGELDIAWQRGDSVQSAKIHVAQGWRRQNITWRPSLQTLVPYLPLSGEELNATQKRALGLPPDQVAFRQGSRVHSRAHDAGIVAGDLIVGIDGHRVSDLDELREVVRKDHLVGERIIVEVLRDGTRLRRSLTLP